MTSFRILILCALCSVACIACRPNDIAPSPGMGDPFPAPVNDPRITILSPELRPWIGFHPAIISNDGERAMSVEIPVRNMTYNAYNIQFRILFFDEHDRQINSVTDWEFVRMEPKQLVRLTRSALSTDAKDYRVEVMWSR